MFFNSAAKLNQSKGINIMKLSDEYSLGICDNGVTEMKSTCQRLRSSQGFNPVCFLKAVEKCEIDE